MHIRGVLNLVAGLSALALLLASALAVPTNIAPSLGTASQSTTYPAGEAFRAIDGDTNGNFFAGSVSHTDFGLTSFWEVSFLEDFVIDNVTVFNRTDCCGERLANVRLSIFDDATEVFGVDLFTEAGTFAPASYVVDTGGATGDRVRIGYIGSGPNQPSNAYLQFAEVQVFAERPGDRTSSVPEPATLGLLAGAILGLSALPRRRRDPDLRP